MAYTEMTGYVPKLGNLQQVTWKGQREDDYF